jgi:hypothetical protein
VLNNPIFRGILRNVGDYFVGNLQHLHSRLQGGRHSGQDLERTAFTAKAPANCLQDVQKNNGGLKVNSSLLNVILHD